MDIRALLFDKNRWGGLAGRVGATGRAALRALLSRFQPRHAPDDFATRPTIPLPEEYQAASDAEILDRLYRNPCGLMNEQPYIDTLMNARNAAGNRKQTRHLIFGFYVLAFSALMLAFNTGPAPTPSGPVALQAPADKPQDSAVALLKEDFNLKLQNKDMEIKDLKRQISLLNQGQADLGRQLKSLAKSASAAAKPQPASKPPKPAP